MPSTRAKVLVLDDDALMLELVATVLGELPVEVERFDYAEEALRRLGEGTFDLAISDVRMPGIDGFEFLERARELAPDMDVMFMTSFASVEDAVRSMQRGALHYVTKPFEPSVFREHVREILVSRENARPEPSPKFEQAVAPIIGRSLALLDVLPLIEDYARCSTTVLIHAETGCGKELVARAIHDAGPRSDGPYVVCNCSAFSDTLMESEFFGHAEGAFTDAGDLRAGLFEQAHGGVIFLDEIGDLPLGTQAKLLRALERGEIQRIGETEARRFDVQVVAATNKDLREEVEAGRFRKDLYYRLNVAQIVLPPLRDRREDIPALAEKFLADAAAEYAKPAPELTPRAMASLRGYSWPGNVRELRNVLYRALLFHEGGPLDLDALPEEIAGAPPSGEEPAETTVEAVRKEHIRRVLEKLHGNKSDAARILGVSRVTLYREIERYGLKNLGA